MLELECTEPAVFEALKSRRRCGAQTQQQLRVGQGRGPQGAAQVMHGPAHLPGGLRANFCFASDIIPN